MRTSFASALCAFLCTFSLSLLDSAAQTETPAAKPGEVAGKPAEEEDLYSLVLINSDLANANSTLDRFDLNDNGRLDAAERRRLDRVGWQTEKFDLNKDGSLTMLEIAVRYAAQRKEFEIIALDERMANGLIARYDINHDRILDAEEMRKSHWPDEPERWDLDKDGRLTHFEVANMHSVGRRGRYEMGITGIDRMTAGRLVVLHDENNDRKLNAEEFRAAVSMEIPKSFDTDGDGELSIEEIAAGYSRKRKQDGVTREDQRAALTIVKRYDVNRDFIVDQAERTRWTEDHAQFDLDKNGEIDLAEIAAFFARERAKQGITNEDQLDAARVLARYDKNKSGTIELGEVENQAGGKEEAGGENGAATTPVTTEAFINFDSNVDGRLGVRELARYIASRRKK